MNLIDNNYSIIIIGDNLLNYLIISYFMNLKLKVINDYRGVGNKVG